MEVQSSRSKIGESSGPLAGVRVVDFCSFIAGSFGAMMLGDMGAEVVKVEPPTGDPSRNWGPFIDGESRLFQGWNRSKRSVALNLKDPRGLEVADDLVRGADVVMENFRPGVSERLGIGYERLKEINKGIVYLSSTAFGHTGPDRLRPGYDPVLQTISGAAKMHERFCDQVHICSVAVSDYGAAMLAAGAVCAALFHRERTGEGQKLETSLLQAVMTVQSAAFIQALEHEEGTVGGIYPYRNFETAEGPLFIAAGTDKFWRLLCDAIGHSDLGEDPRYDTNPKRVAAIPELEEKLKPIFLRRSSRDWESLLVEKGVPCAAARTALEFFDEPQVEALEMNPVIQHSKLGPLRVSGLPVGFSQTPCAIQSAAPLLGEHSREVLAALGYEDSRITSLVEAGVVVEAGGG